MIKEEILKLMVRSLNQDNLEMAERSGMDRSEIDKLVEQSQPSLQFMVSNMYDRMKAADILKD
jgi:hypothetical protein